MTKVLFVCHGNICRSPMAEFIFRNIAEINGMGEAFEIASAATSREELGNDIYPPARKVIAGHSIPFKKRAARQISAEDTAYYDYIVLMDENNRRNLLRMFPDIDMKKVSSLMSFAGSNEDVSDPWYTGDFLRAYEDINKGCLALFNFIKEKADNTKALIANNTDTVKAGNAETAKIGNTELKPGRYRHFKGREYELICIARHSETEEKMVVYRALYGDFGIWVRPLSMWNETVIRDGKQYRRFEYIGPEK